MNASPSASSMLVLLWSRFTWRHWRTQIVSSALLVGIVALGVGVYFSVRLANRAAVASFQNFTDTLTSGSDGLMLAPSGLLPESILGELRSAFGGAPVQMIPVLESTAAIPRTSEAESIGSRETYTLLGVDLVALQNWVGGRTRGSGQWLTGRESSDRSPPGKGTPAGLDATLWSVFRDPRSVYVGEAQATKDGLRVGSELRLVIQERIVPLRVAGVIPSEPGRPNPPSQLLVMDLPALQRLTDSQGQLSRVEFLVEEGPNRSERWAMLRQWLQDHSAKASGSPRWIVSSPADRRSSAEKMTRAFRLNLTILSLLALLVGLYLVFQALDGAVVRRRDEMAILRSLGVRPSDLRKAWMLEAVMLGLLGGVAGLALGWGGAQGAVRLVGRTVNALYYATPATAAALDAGEAVVALVISVATCLLAGWIPARAAAAIPPAQVLSRSQGAQREGPAWLRHPGLACALAGMGWLLCFLPPIRMQGGGRFPLASYGAALLWVLAAGILGGCLLQLLARRLGLLGRESVPWRVALSHLRRPSGRHRLAVAGLVCAVAMTAGMAILVGSFDRTMRSWIGRTFQADLYVSSDGAQSASSENRISPETWRAVASHTAVERAQVIQAARLQLPVGETLLVGCDLQFFRDFARPAWVVEPLSDSVFAPDSNASEALVSEAFSERFLLTRGDSVDIPTPAGRRTVTIAGVFSDYGNERGSLMVDRRAFSDWFGNELASSLVLVLRPGFDAGEVRSTLRTAHPGLAVFTQSFLRTEALRIFRQTFAITDALELIGMVVAVAGLGFTMVSLLWERREELATLRKLGLRRRELAIAAACEGLLTAVSGVGIGIAASLALGWLLIFRINRQTFGWTLETHWPWLTLFTLTLLVITSAWLTSWLTGIRAARIPAEREE